MLHKKAEEVSAKEVDAGSGTELQVLIGPDEAPNFCMRRFIMKPGGGMPEHTNTVEHQQYVLCLLYTSPSPRDKRQSRMPSSA